MLIFLGLASGIGAALEWEVEERKLKAHPVQLSIATSFPFANTGKEAVEILKVDASCGCLVPKLVKKRYEPGESGRIDVQFLLLGRTGKHHKYIMVKTSANPTVAYRLKVSVDIPIGYVSSSKRLLWERLPEHAPQTCRLSNKSGQSIELGETTPTVGCIKVELKPVKPGYEYDLVVTPAAGTENLRAFVRIRTIPPNGFTESKYYKIYLYIK